MERLRGVAGLPAYYLAATSARVGDEMVGVAVVLLVLARTGSTPLAGAVVAGYTLPTLLSGPFLGAWLDRTRFRRGALAANQLLLGLVMLGLLGALGRWPAGAVVALAALVGVSVPMTSGGFTSLLPRLVPRGLLPRAHAVEGTTFNAAAIAGPAAAATVAALATPAAAVATIAGFAALSLLALTRVPAAAGVDPAAATGQPAGSGPVAGSDPRAGLLDSVRGGLAHLLRTRPLRSVTVATSVGFVGFGMLTVALPLTAERLAGDAALAGYAWAAIESGAVVTALAWGRWHARWRPERVVLAASAGFGLALLGWPLAGSFGVLLGLAGLAGLATGAGLPALFTTRQRYTPADIYAQVSTTGASLKLGGFAIGAALAGQFAPVLGPATLLTVAAVIELLAAATGTALLGRNRAEIVSPSRKTAASAPVDSAVPREVSGS